MNQMLLMPVAQWGDMVKKSLLSILAISLLLGLTACSDISSTTLNTTDNTNVQVSGIKDSSAVYESVINYINGSIDAGTISEISSPRYLYIYIYM